MLNDGISMWASVAVILHDNHIISHCILVSYTTGWFDTERKSNGAGIKHGKNNAGLMTTL